MSDGVSGSKTAAVSTHGVPRVPGILEEEKHVTCPKCDVTHKVPERGVKAFTENQHVIQLVADKKVR